MGRLLLTALTSAFYAVQSYAEKRTVSSGISRRDFFFYSCLCLLPFAAIMVLITPFRLNFSFQLVWILAASLALRYGKLTAIVSTVERLVPYESEAYMCLGVILAYVIDCVLGVKTLSRWGALSIALALTGVFLIADVKLRVRKLQRGLIIRILCDVGSGYCARYALRYCSNAMYILLLNALVVMISCWGYRLSYHKGMRGVIRLVLVQQFLGFLCLFFGNMVAQRSVTAYAFVRPMTLGICVVIAMFYKDKRVLGDRFGVVRRPKVRDAVAIGLIIGGICLQGVG